VVQSTTSPKEQHKHSKQLGHRPKERYDRLLRPRSDLQYKSVDYPKKSIINSINSTTSQEETSYGKAEKSHKERQGETFPYYSKTSQKKKKDRSKPAHFSQRQIQKQGKA